jgi:hypothetical protein
MELRRWLRLQWDRVAAALAVVAGLVALGLGWVGVSGTVYPAEQIPYLATGGLLGVFALGIGATMWLSADLRDEWRKLDDINTNITNVHEALVRRHQSSEPDLVGSGPHLRRDS